MLFHMELISGAIVGWVLPDNPSTMPSVRIVAPGREPFELEANVTRTDLRDRGMHETGRAGFYIDERVYPGLSEVIDSLEIREVDRNILVFRKYLTTKHLAQKVLRLDLQSMPDPNLEMAAQRHFTFYHHAIHAYPQDTLFGVLNNQTSNSIYLAGRLSFQQNEHWFHEREYKIICLIKNPYEDLAERLLFTRFVSAGNLPVQYRDYAFGLEPLFDVAKAIKFDDVESIGKSLANLTEAQIALLNNPLIRSIACLSDERPKGAHIEIALSKLSRMQLVGLKSRFSDFKSILVDVLGADIFDEALPTPIAWVSQAADMLPHIKQARNLVALDLDAYSFVEEAIEAALGPARRDHSQDSITTLHPTDTTANETSGI